MNTRNLSDYEIYLLAIHDSTELGKIYNKTIKELQDDKDQLYIECGAIVDKKINEERLRELIFLSCDFVEGIQEKNKIKNRLLKIIERFERLTNEAKILIEKYEKVKDMTVEREEYNKKIQKSEVIV